MNELDCVKLIKPYRKLKVGVIGIILIKYDENNFEVEFVDKDKNTLDVCTISKDYIELYLVYEENRGNKLWIRKLLKFN